MAISEIEIYDFPTHDNNPVRADFYLPCDEPWALVVICHGFKGHRRWGFIPTLARRIAAEEIAALAIDFSFNGTYTEEEEEGPKEGSFSHNPYARPDLFRRNTLAREIRDLACVLQDLARGEPIGWKGPIGLFGHSRAGVTVILNALENRQVMSIATWAAPTNPDVFTPEQKRKWREKGSLEFIDARNGAHLAVDLEYLLDLEKNKEKYSMAKAVKSLGVPHLLVHGIHDLSIPASAAVELHQAERGVTRSELVLLRCGHTFQSDLIGEGRAHILMEACSRTARWFADTLRGRIE